MFIKKLFELEVPELVEGVIEIKAIAREPGERAKIAVISHDPDVDPVGACVGMKGSRVQNVVQELRGEKIDIIPWHVDPAKFVCNALAPAEISRVIIDEEHRSMEVIVPDEFLSVAIGKRGQNVRLASKLTRWRLDVKSESRYSRDMRDGYESLVAMPDVGISLADALYEKGFFSAEELSRATVDDLLRVRGMTDAEAEKLIELAKDYMLHSGDSESRPRVTEDPEAKPTEAAPSASDDADAATTTADDADIEGPNESPPAESGSELTAETLEAEPDADAPANGEDTDEDAPETEPKGDASADTDAPPTVDDGNPPSTNPEDDSAVSKPGAMAAIEAPETAAAETENGDGSAPNDPVADPEGDGRDGNPATQ